MLHRIRFELLVYIPPAPVVNQFIHIICDIRVFVFCHLLNEILQVLNVLESINDFRCSISISYWIQLGLGLGLVIDLISFLFCIL